MLKILHNHLGYECDEPKRALLVCDGPAEAGEFRVVDDATGETAFIGSPKEAGPVAKWDTGYYYVLDFGTLQRKGAFRILCSVDGRQISSFPFAIRKNLLGPLLSDAAFYFKAQRISGEWLHEDRNLGFLGGLREGRRDVHGGWYDASGDTGAHMSHLSHSTYFNPQQHPFSTYMFFKTHDLMEESGNPLYLILRRRYLDEAYWGADFIMRMRAESGSFFRAIRRLDSYGSVHGTRKLDYEYNKMGRLASKKAGIEEEVTDYNYETSLRGGGGMCIAALAMAGAHFYPSAEFTQREYIMAAKESYDYLEANNEKYANDGKWNLLDEYCALAAVTELYKATGEYVYRYKGRKLSGRILERMVDMGPDQGYFSVDGTGRPFFHAADAGMPVIALLNFAEVENDEETVARILDACKKVMAFELHLTGHVVNPFGYARQYVYTSGTFKETFFFPHDTEAAPWWQGENARLASLAAAAGLLAEHLEAGSFHDALIEYASNQINWILGLNPFDSCMVEGRGRNNPAYYSNYNFCFMSCPGGICNGITAGYDDDETILYIAEEDEREADNWRWGEQWIPHLSWFMYAVAIKKK